MGQTRQLKTWHFHFLTVAYASDLKMHGSFCLSLLCHQGGDPGKGLHEQPGYLCPDTIDDPCITISPFSPTPALEFDHSEGTMPPHSQDTINLTARPKVRSKYSWTISYCLLSQRGT